MEKEAPAKAATMREWSRAAQDGMIKWFSDVLIEQPHPETEQELWRVMKGGRELSCVAVYFPIGIDLRVMEGTDFRRTHLVKETLAEDMDAPVAPAQKFVKQHPKLAAIIQRRGMGSRPEVV